jgi:hypothetical protein
MKNLAIGPNMVPTEPAPGKIRKEGSRILSFSFDASTVAVGAGVYTSASVFTALIIGVRCWLRQVIVSPFIDNGAAVHKPTSVQFRLTNNTGAFFSRGVATTLGAEGSYGANAFVEFFGSYQAMPMQVQVPVGAFQVNSNDSLALVVAFTENFANLDPLRARIILMFETA